MEGCELCSHPARIHCEPDQAKLCWDCDEKVHSANFLVAKHTRCLLCQVCQSPTSWRASGPKLVPTLSVCDTCLDKYLYDGNQQQQISNSCGGVRPGLPQPQESEIDDDDDDDDDAEYYYGEDSNYDDEEEEDDENEDGENQVVPWSETPLSPPGGPSPSTSTNTLQGMSSSAGSVGTHISLRRLREKDREVDYSVHSRSSLYSSLAGMMDH